MLRESTGHSRAAETLTRPVIDAQPVKVRLVRIAAYSQWREAADWPGEREGEPSDLLGQGMPGPRDLGGCVEQPQAAHSRPGEGLGGLRRAQATARRLPRRSFVPQACRTIGGGLVNGSSALRPRWWPYPRGASWRRAPSS